MATNRKMASAASASGAATEEALVALEASLRLRARLPPNSDDPKARPPISRRGEKSASFPPPGMGSDAPAPHALRMMPTERSFAGPNRGHARFAPRRLDTINVGAVPIPDPERLVHLQMRRFAGCPICSLHLRTFALRHEELVAARVVEVAVFHSSVANIRKVHTNQPFAIVADPERRLYDELGVGTSASAMLDPSVWLAAARALHAGASADPRAGSGDGSFGLPGDFLIAPDGRIVAAYRGAHADDQWSFDELLEIVAIARGGA